MWRTVLLILLRPFALLTYLLVCGVVYFCAFIFCVTGGEIEPVWKLVREMDRSCREFLLPPISHSARV